MILLLAKQQWREAIRSTVWKRNVGANIFFGFIFALLALQFLSLGIFIDKILLEFAPKEDPVDILLGLLVFYFIADLKIRLFMQKTHGLEIKPYLYLPVKRSALVHYILSKSFLSIFNFLPLFVLVPFSLKTIPEKYCYSAAFIWLATIFFLILCNSFIVTFLKKSAVSNLRYIIIFLALFAGAVLLEMYGIYSISSDSVYLFKYLLENPITIFLVFILFLTIYIANFRLLISNTYLENIKTRKIFSESSKLYNFIERFGEVGTFIILELKLLLRNKRSRLTIYFTFGFLLIGFIFYTSNSFDRFYPQPGTNYANVLDEYKSNLIGSEIHNVKFEVNSKSIPANANVFLTGNQNILNNWKAEGMPLFLNSDSAWSLTLPIEKDTYLEYKFTLGSWETQMLTSGGIVPENLSLQVEKDTTIALSISGWKNPIDRPFTNILFVYVGIMLTGIFLMSYGQFIFCWESSNFEGILTQRINLKNYFQAKYMIMLASVILFYIITLPYGFFGSQIIKYNSVIAIYNIGVNSYLLFFLSTFARKKLDLNVSIMSTQGKGASQYLLVFPSLFVPTLIFVPFAVSQQSDLGLLVLAGLGILGLIFNKQIMNLLYKQFQNQRYKIVSGFRQS